jgi:hypothetical protein
MELLGIELPGVGLPTLRSLALGAAGCLAFAGSNCSVGIGVGEKMLKAGLVGATGLGLGAGEGTDWSFGWTGELLESDDGAAPELAGRTSRALLKFEVGSAPVRLVTASGTAEVAVGPG